MGFGSYDESEQGNQEVDTEDIGDDDLKDEAEHDGDVEFEMEDTDSALERLQQIRDEDEESDEP